MPDNYNQPTTSSGNIGKTSTVVYDKPCRFRGMTVTEGTGSHTYGQIWDSANSTTAGKRQIMSFGVRAGPNGDNNGFDKVVVPDEGIICREGLFIEFVVAGSDNDSFVLFSIGL